MKKSLINFTSLFAILIALAAYSKSAIGSTELSQVIDCIGYHKVAGDIAFDDNDKKLAAIYYNASTAFANAAKKMGAKGGYRKESEEKFMNLARQRKIADIAATGKKCADLMNNNKTVKEELNKILN